MPNFIKVDTPPTDRTAGLPQEQNPGNVDQNAVEEFRRSLQGDDRTVALPQEQRPGKADQNAVEEFRPSLQGDEQNKGSAPDTETGRRTAPNSKPAGNTTAELETDRNTKGRSEANPAHAPLLSMESLFGGRMPTVASEAPAPAAPPAAHAELTEKLVERILVGQNQTGEHEVRLTLGKDILPDTEIRISRDVHGMLQVSLNTDNPSSFQTLVSAQDALRTRLEQTEADVRVHVSTQTSAEDNDSGRRSRGLIPEPEMNRD
jgi:type III secretion system needle length determinant